MKVVESVKDTIIQQGLPKDVSDKMTIYMLPEANPTAYTAETRGYPKSMIDYSGNLLVVYMENDLYTATHTKNAGGKDLNDLIITGQVNSNDPEYGIDMNRDVKEILPSTNALDRFEEAAAAAGTAAIKSAIFINLHEKASRGMICPGYTIQNKKHVVDPGYFQFTNVWAKSIKATLPDSKAGYIFSDALLNPNKYAGEFIRTQQFFAPGTIAMDFELQSEYAGNVNAIGRYLADFCATLVNQLKAIDK